MKVRMFVVTSVIAALWVVVPSASQAATPSCHGKPATIVGTSAGEPLSGTNGNDVIVGNGGDDTINGLGGNDTICGGEGDDTINGGKGRDVIDGEKGRDTLVGGDDNDDIFGGPGVDTCTDVTPAEENAGHEHDCDADFQVTADLTMPVPGPNLTFAGRLDNAGPSDEHDSLLRIRFTSNLMSSPSVTVQPSNHATATCSVLTNTSTEYLKECTVDMGSGSHVTVSGAVSGLSDITFTLFTSPHRSVDPDWSNNSASDTVPIG